MQPEVVERPATMSLCFGFSLGRTVARGLRCTRTGCPPARSTKRLRVADTRGLRMTAVQAADPAKSPSTQAQIPQGVPTFQEAIARLQKYWAEQGCVVWHPYNHELGAGTMNPATFLRVLGPEPWAVAYDEPSIRPDDSRYGENPNRVQRHTQFQVIMKPAPDNCQELLLGSYQVLGVDVTAHDVRFVEDNWESPALGAWGLGWEVWLDGMEVTQFTYFQQAGGYTCEPVALEITYGLERIMMSLQKKNHFKDIVFAPGVTYGDLFMQNEVEMSQYNLDMASIERNFVLFDVYEKESREMIEKRLPIPAYNYLLKASNTFNILDARGAIGVTERATFFRKMRGLAREAAQLWYARREEQGFPLIKEGAATTKDKKSSGEGKKSWSTPAEKVSFCLEIGTEELPPQSVDSAIVQLKTLLLETLRDNNLRSGSIKTLATPRRLIAIVEDLDSRQADSVSKVKGPPRRVAESKDGELTQAALGFCRKNGVDPSQIEWEAIKGQDYLVASVASTGRYTGEILTDVLPSVVEKISFRKTMRWNSSGATFSRPVRWVVTLLDDQVIEAEIAGITSGRVTRGLRGFAGATPLVSVQKASDLEAVLRSQGIVSDISERRSMIKDMAVESASSVAGEIPKDYLEEDGDSLLEEIKHLVEAPKAVLGHFDEKFLQLPKSVLTTVMKKHQRYFPVENESGDLVNAFITISNGPTDDTSVREGNEAVLRARYEDAAFFYGKDTKQKLEEFKPQLGGMVFQDKLGSMLDKNVRVEKVTEQIAQMIGASSAETASAKRAAELFKADLASNVVVEFTSLAAEMGRHYAQCSGESPEVAQAIYESVLPRTVTDETPQSLAGCALAVADRLDSLVGLFAAGCAPTANADVFALRRTAVGLVSVIMNGGLPLNIRDGVEVLASVQPIPLSQETKEQVVEFVVKRLESALLERGYRVDLVRSVIREQGVLPSSVGSALQELIALADSEKFSVALEVYSRPSRLIKSKKDMIESDAVDPSLFESEIESNLFAAFQSAQKAIKEGGSTVTSVVDALESIRGPVDYFFENVFVMSDDERVRQNRLALCLNLSSLTRGILDLTEIQ